MGLLINTSRKSFTVGRPFERKVDDNGYQRAASHRNSPRRGGTPVTGDHALPETPTGPHELRNRT